MIPKRVTWFVGGVAAGAAGTGYVKNVVRKKARRTAQRLKPTNIARRAVGVQVVSEAPRDNVVRRVSSNVAGALREGRAAMKAREAELRARRDHRIETIDDKLDPGDQLLVDGQPVDAARVYVLKRK